MRLSKSGSASITRQSSYMSTSTSYEISRKNSVSKPRPVQRQASQQKPRVIPTETLKKKRPKVISSASAPNAEKQKWQAVLQTLQQMDISTKRWKASFEKIKARNKTLKADITKKAVKIEKLTEKGKTLKEENKKLKAINKKQESEMKDLKDKTNRLANNEAAQIEILHQQNLELRRHREDRMNERGCVEELSKRLFQSQSQIKELSKQLVTSCLTSPGRLLPSPASIRPPGMPTPGRSNSVAYTPSRHTPRAQRANSTPRYRR